MLFQDGAQNRPILRAWQGKVVRRTLPSSSEAIHRHGVHFTELFYDQSGLASAAVFDGRPQRPDPPSDVQIDLWLATERRRFTTDPQPFYAGHATGARA